MPLRRLLLIASAMLFAPVALLADDWPQWMGPKRDNVWRETGIIDKFPDGRPKIALAHAASAAATRGRRSRTGRSMSPIASLAKGAANPDDPFDTTNKINSTERVLCLDAEDRQGNLEARIPSAPTRSVPRRAALHAARSRGEGLHPRRDGQSLLPRSGFGQVRLGQGPQDGVQDQAGHCGVTRPTRSSTARSSSPSPAARAATSSRFDKDTGKEIWKAGQQPEQGYSPPCSSPRPAASGR